MTRVDVLLDDATLAGEPLRVGRLFRDGARRGDILRFEYDPHWLARPEAFEIEPLLPLRDGPFHAADPTQPPNVFQDCAPDRWGRLLMDRREAIESRAEDRPRRVLREWDYLVGVDDGTRMGALRLLDHGIEQFVASRHPRAPPMTSLRELEAIARLVEQDTGSEVDKQILQLIVPGSSLGGARPKASFVDERGELWLAKFPSSEDRHDVGLWEFLASRLASGCRKPGCCRCPRGGIPSP